MASATARSQQLGLLASNDLSGLPLTPTWASVIPCPATSDVLTLNSHDTHLFLFSPSNTDSASTLCQPLGPPCEAPGLMKGGPCNGGVGLLDDKKDLSGESSVLAADGALSTEP